MKLIRNSLNLSLGAALLLLFLLTASTVGAKEIPNRPAPAAPAATILYVDKEAAGPTHNGLSWTTAYTTVQNALDWTNSHAGTTYEVWVAEGLYYPDEGAGHVNNAARETFRIERNNVQLYGGFAATETLRTQRNWTAHPTIFSGDLTQNDTTVGGVVTNTAGITGPNADHVMFLDGVTYGSITGTVVLDGFILTAGDASYPYVTNADKGGGLYCAGEGVGHDCSPTLTHITFSGNFATYGGGMYNNGSNNGVSSPLLTNITFYGNSAASHGGGIYNNGDSGVSSPTLINVTLYDNSAAFGSGIFDYNDSAGSSLTLINCIVWGNTGSDDAQIFSFDADTSVTYSDIQGGYAGTGNLNLDPLFIDAARGNLRLGPGSPAADAGNTLSVTAATDLDGYPRVSGTAVDMGAYESNYSRLTLQIVGSNAGIITSQPAGVNCNTTCTTYFDTGTVVTLTATPLLSNIFIGWSGAITSSANTITLIMNGARVVTATFFTYSITPTAGMGGSITPGTPQIVIPGSAVTFTIAPDTGYHTTGVYVDGAPIGVVDSYAFTNVTANHIITAAFAINTYIITPTAGIGGTINPGGPQTVTYDGSAAFTITPNPGYYIGNVYVDGASIGMVNSYTFTHVTADHTITAAFVNSILHVDKDAPGPVHDGLSWTTAYTTVQNALDWTNSHAGTMYEVWVAEGLYYPDEGAGHVDNAARETFRIERNNVQLYGGFAATETLRTQRNWTAHPTILSGDLDQNDATVGGVVTNTAGITGTNAYHVMFLDGVTYGSITDTVVLDGFILTAGNACGSYPNVRGGGLFCEGNTAGHACSPALTHITFSGNSATEKGGGMYNDGFSGGVSNPSLTNVTFNHNAAAYGGGMFNAGYAGQSSPALTNVVFYGNSATNDGGGIYNEGYSRGVSNPSLTNVTFYDNSAGNQGGGIASDGGAFGISNPTLVNGIVWGNTAPQSAQIYNYKATPTVTYSDIQGGYTGTMNLNRDPQFIDAAMGNLRLSPGSPAIDAGNTLSVTAATDLDNHPRVSGTAVDMGAYESNYSRLTLQIVGNDAGIITSQPAGVSCSASCTAYFYPGTLVTLTVTPTGTAAFIGWSGAITSTANTITLTMNGDRAVTATFSTYLITPTAGMGGSITPGTPQAVASGSAITFTIAPNTGYHTTGVYVDGAPIGVVGSYAFTNVTTNHIITAAFAINTYTITPTASVNGSITPGVPQTVNYGSSAVFTIAPALGYHIIDVRADGTSVGAVSVYTFTNVTANHTITAAFAVNTYIITATAGANGSISPNGPQTVTYGSSAAFSINPNPNYHVIDVWVDGISVGTPSVYTFTNITADHTITTAFDFGVYYPLTVTIIGNNAGLVSSQPIGINCNGGSCAASFAPGTVVTLTATSTRTASFDGWSGAITGTASVITVTMDGPKAVTATFRTHRVFLPIVMKGK